ncbi:MAG: hypothetical protein ACFFC5_06555 [Promethearchaeota archaeon]
MIEMEEIRYKVIGIATRLRKVLELLREIETLLVTLPREDFKDRGMLGFFSEFIRKVAKEYEATERATK